MCAGNKAPRERLNGSDIILFIFTLFKKTKLVFVYLPNRREALLINCENNDNIFHLLYWPNCKNEENCRIGNNTKVLFLDQ